MDKSKIRNFSIIAHIDHGKSTLSDRIIEITNGISKREMKDQILDSMDLERERGITIKLNAVQLIWKDYIFHLIDTPGHIDFTYEVSRSLAACEGALLVVDATQGVQAQTLTNVFLALENDLEIIPVINKVDLPGANVEGVKKEISELVGLSTDTAPCISAKTGLNIEAVIDAIINRIPAPTGSNDEPLQALIFDSYYDKYKGVVCLIRIKNGVIKTNQSIKFMNSGKTFNVVELGVRTPKVINKDTLESGEVGWLAANIKSAKDIWVGDTITDAHHPAAKPLPGYKKITPMVFSGIYPVDNAEFPELKDAMEKINLSDSSLSYEFENSGALGNGIRCGFLGLLHMEIIKERIEREYNIPIILTSPCVKYEVVMTNGEVKIIENPALLPDRTFIKEIQEPWVKLTIITPERFMGEIMKLITGYRGSFIKMNYVEGKRYELIYDIPLGEILYTFFDQLKTVSQGYATMEYEITGNIKGNLVKVDILLNGEKVDAFSFISHVDFASVKGRRIVEKLKEFIPRQQFEVPVQAVIGGKVIARETIKSMGKNVLAKCYGGDKTRQMKLLEAQKEGKKRLKAIGKVSLPNDIFIKILKSK